MTAQVRKLKYRVTWREGRAQVSHHGGWGVPSVLPDPHLSKSTWRLDGNAPWGGWVSHHRLGLRQTMKAHSPDPLCTTLRSMPQEGLPTSAASTGSVPKH